MSEAKIHISGRITKGETLIDVIRQFKSFEDPTEITVEINSNGGNKNEGDAVYDYLKNLDAEIPVTTVTGKAYSIAAKIFAAGSKRIVKEGEEVLMIHFARAITEGTAEELEGVAAELRVIEDEFIEFYSEHLNIDEETVRNLLDNETFVSSENAVEIGFATEVENVAEIVAELSIENLKSNKMTAKKEKSKGRILLEAMAEFAGYEIDNEGKIKKKEEVVAELTLQDSNATEIVFPDLESDGTPSVGDKATIDGVAIPDGSYIMPSLEDATVVFVDGAVSEIIPKDEEEDVNSEIEARYDQAKKDFEIKAETEGLEISTWSMRLVNDSFAVGDVVKYYDWENNESLVSASEIKIADGRTIVTDATGTIVLIKEADAPTQVIDDEPEANFEDLKEKMSEKLKTEIEAEMKAEHEAELQKKEEVIISLKAKLGSKEYNAEEKEIPEKKTKGSRAAEILAAGRK